MRTNDLGLLKVEHQQEITRRIKKLHWLQERFGDEAKYQGFMQDRVVNSIISEVMMLALLIMAEID